MSEATTQIKFRWADLDPNYHVRHSVYYDVAAQFRMEYMTLHGVNFEFFQQSRLNPVLLKEECVFKREIKYWDEITIALEMMGVSEDFSKYTMRNTFIRKDGVTCAELTIFGGWLDMTTRKLVKPPELILNVFDKIPKHAEFAFLSGSKSPK